MLYSRFTGDILAEAVMASFSFIIGAEAYPLIMKLLMEPSASTLLKLPSLVLTFICEARRLLLSASTPPH